MKIIQKNSLAKINSKFILWISMVGMLVGCARPVAIGEEETFFQSETENLLDKQVIDSQGQDMQYQGATSDGPGQKTTEVNEVNVISVENEVSIDNDFCYVYVCGYVQKPGVYELKKGSRLYEAVDAAGGFLEDASEDYCNLAQIIEDEKQYYIPSEEEVENSLEQRGASHLQMMSEQEDRQEIKKDNSNNETNQSCFTTDGKLDINMATVNDFQQLNGIGETRAKAIFEYREANGPFEKCSDIMKVSGIKEGTFKQFEDQIIVR